MGEAVLKADYHAPRKKGKRFAVCGILKGKLVDIEHNIEFSPQPKIVDISYRGLGLITKFKLHQGQRLSIQFTDGDMLSLEVIHCSNHLGISGIYRCGLFIRSEIGSTEAILNKFGLVPIGELHKLY